VTPTDHDVDPVDGEGRPGLNRRQMIKAAGIAGAAAWTAPMIIDSLSSPAAAATVAPGCYRMWLAFTSPGGSWALSSWQGTAPNGCQPPGCSNDTASAAAAVTLAGTQPGDNSSTLAPVTVTVNSGISCRITSASAAVTPVAGFLPPFVCETATGSSSGTRVTWSFVASPSSVTMTPHGDVSGTANDGFWRNTSGARSSIGIVLTCP
jgi:hypothetical protein